MGFALRRVTWYVSAFSICLRAFVVVMAGISCYFSLWDLFFVGMWFLSPLLTI